MLGKQWQRWSLLRAIGESLGDDAVDGSLHYGGGWCLE